MRKLAFYILFMFSIVGINNVTIAGEKEASDFIEGLGDEVLNILNSSGISENDKHTKLEHMFADNVDSDWIGKFALGRYARQVPEEKLSQYLSLFKEFLIRSYVSNFKKHTKETFKITSTSKQDADQFLVSTEIMRTNKKPLEVDYLVRENHGGTHPYIIIDIIAEGVSLLTTERSEFSGILSNNGIDSLISMLKEKVSSQD